MHILRTLPLALVPAFALLLMGAAAPNGCNEVGDPLSQPDANPLGTGYRIAQIGNPDSGFQPANNGIANISGAAVVWLDTFDETHNGKSLGTLYLQDVGSSAPFAGISTYKQALVPANHVPTPGDVFNLTGTFSEATSVGTATFPPGTYLVQLDTPTCEFEYEYTPPVPAVIDVTDLDNFSTGLKWTSMLVTVHNVTLGAGYLASSGRVTYSIQNNGTNPPDVANELYNLGPNDFPAGTTFESITGVVTWFDNYEIAPRSAADFVVAQ